MGLRVCLCGEGADELFAGYPEFRRLADNPGELSRLQSMFLNQLCRTQLQRVDRMGMAHTVEVREPYLDQDVVNFACQLPRSYMLRQDNNSLRDKFILRKAAELRIPKEFAWREKSPISAGAGAGGNARRGGLFYEHAQKAMTEEKTTRLVADNPEYGLATKEDALYFDWFQGFGYKQLEGFQNRPTVNSQ